MIVNKAYATGVTIGLFMWLATWIAIIWTVIHFVVKFW